MRHRVTLYTLWFLTKEITSEIGKHGGGSDEVHFQSIIFSDLLVMKCRQRGRQRRSQKMG